MNIPRLDERSHFTFVRKATINEFSWLYSSSHCGYLLDHQHTWIIHNSESIPLVVIQCFLCRRRSSSVLCRIEGFNSFLNDCMTMYMLVALSITWYSTTVNASSRCIQQLLKKYNRSLMIICCILGST